MVVPLNFNTLTPADQADLLQAEGAFMNTRQEAAFVIDRYRLHNFYVDVYYQAATDEPTTVRSFYPRQQRPPIYQMPLPRLYIRQGA
jgi:hypothetical protein